MTEEIKNPGSSSDRNEENRGPCRPSMLRKRWYLIPFFVIGALLLFGFIVMLLWNCLLPGLFGFHTLNLWEAIGILILAKILFGAGFSKGKHWGRGDSGFGMEKHRREWKEKWLNMTEEERIKFKEEWKNRCKF
jgi:hypothetical protein